MLLLPGVFVQVARPHARRQRGFAFHPLFIGVGEEIHRFTYCFVLAAFGAFMACLACLWRV